MRQDALMPYTAASIAPHRWPGFGSSNSSSLTAGSSPEPLSASLARPSFSLRRERRDGVLLNMSEYPRLRAFADPDLLPALKPQYAHRRPALGLGELDPPPRILLLYGSLRERSYSRLVVEEAARLLQFFGCETRIFDPSDLPLPDQVDGDDHRSEEHTSELQSLMRISYAVFCLKKKTKN